VALRPVPARAPGADGSARVLPRWVRVLLDVPLRAKIIGANALIVLTAAGVAVSTAASHGSGRSIAEVMAVALLVSLIVNVLLVSAALRPIEALESTAERVWRGDFGARVPPSQVADRNMARVGRTVNLLLDGLMEDRVRMRRLASQVIRAQDDERARIARELHDSTAQTLAAIVFQLSAMTRECADPALCARLEEIKGTAVAAMEEVRTLSHTVHPRVLDDLGLVPALRWLARRTQESAGVAVTVDATGDVSRLSPPAVSVLYRVAQEALSNAVRHAEASAVAITIRASDASATLEVADDGRGFDVAAAEARRPGMGLFSMRERVGLVNGQLALISAPGAGTRVVATVPLGAPSPV
jgi:signal transduction histidine kinase